MIRPSARPMLRLCPSSQVGGYRLNVTGPHVNVGIAVDAAMGRMIQYGPLKPEEVALLAKMHDADPDEVSDRVLRGALVLSLIREEIGPAPFIQARIDGPLGVGTPDAHNTNPPVVVDWKSREDDRHWDQMMHYAHSLACQIQDPDTVVTVIPVWLATGTYEIRRVNAAALIEWEKEQVRLERLVGEVYGPGEHCTRCNRRLDCEVRRAWAECALEVIQKQTPVEQAAQAYPAALQAEKIIADYKAAMKEAVLAAGDPIPVDEDQELAVIDVTRRSLDNGVAESLMRESGWTREEILAVSEIKIGAVEKLVKSKAPRGQKKQAVEDANEWLADAIRTKTTKTLKLRRKL